MSQSLFLAATEKRSGKSAIALGVMEMLKRTIARVGFFRPIVTADHEAGELDHDIQLIATCYDLQAGYEEMYGCTLSEALALTSQGRADEVMDTVMRKYHKLADQKDFVLCEGTDFEGASTTFEFDVNAEVARNLGSPVLLVAQARDRSVDDTLSAIELTLDSLTQKGCEVLSTIANRVAPENRWELLAKLRMLDVDDTQLLFAIPEVRPLACPTVREVAEVLNAKVLYGQEQMDRDVVGFHVAAMHLSNVLARIEPGSLVITPGDRADVLVACLAAASSATLPVVSGIVLSGGMEPDGQVRQLIEGLPNLLPILSVPQLTFEAARRVDGVQSLIAPTDQRKINRAIGVFEQNVDVDRLERAVITRRTPQVTPKMFEYMLIRRAQQDLQRIVLPEGDDPRILRGAEILARREVARIVLLGDAVTIQSRAARLGLSLADVEIVNPAHGSRFDEYVQRFHELRAHKGITEENARDALSDPNYFGTMMVYLGDADGMVSGATHTTAATIRPAFEIIKTRPGARIVSSVFFMCLEDKVLVYGDCAINPNPNAEQLAEIALSSAYTARTFGVPPRVALLSYSTGESGHGSDVDTVRAAAEIARARAKEEWPELSIEGPIQYDAAVDPSVAKTKMADSDVAGHATVLIFPDLNTGNNTYKAVQRSAGAVAVGPVLQGLNRPVNDLSRGCTIPDIVNTVAITAVQAQPALNVDSPLELAPDE